MSSDDNIRLYRRDPTSKNPLVKLPHSQNNRTIDRGPSGSSWGLPQIEWLGIKFEWGCDISQTLGSDSEFQPNAHLQRSIFDATGKPWAEILDQEDIEQVSFYGSLSALAHIRTPLDYYDKSSAIEAPSSPAAPDRDELSPFSTPPKSQECTTPRQHIRSSPPSMAASPTPRPKGQPLVNSHSQEPHTPWSSPLSSPPATIKTPPSYPKYGTKESPLMSSPTPRGNVKSGTKGVYPSSFQVAVEPTSSESATISKDQLEAEHKPEKDVEQAVRSFLSLLRTCFGNRCKANEKDSHRQWDLRLEVR